MSGSTAATVARVDDGYPDACTAAGPSSPSAGRPNGVSAAAASGGGADDEPLVAVAASSSAATDRISPSHERWISASTLSDDEGLGRMPEVGGDGAACSSTTGIGCEAQRSMTAMDQLVRVLPANAPPSPDGPSFEVLIAAMGIIEASYQAVASETILPPPDRITWFHSEIPPDVPLTQYAHTIVYYCRADTHGFALALALMVRRSVVVGEPPNLLTAHRLFLTCLTVGMKANSDIRYTNKYVASVGGITAKELTDLETALMLELGWRAVPTPDEMVRFPTEAVALSASYAAAATAATSSSPAAAAAAPPPPLPPSVLLDLMRRCGPVHIAAESAGDSDQ